MSPMRTADEKGSARPPSVERDRYSGPPSAICFPLRLVDHLAVADTPDVRHANEAVVFADLDPAPAVVAFADPPDDARFGHVAGLGAVISADAHGPRRAGLDQRRPPIAEQGHEHPALRAVG